MRKRLTQNAIYISRSGVSERELREAALAAQVPLPGPRVPLAHPHTMLGWMLAHAYEQLTRQAIAAASATTRSTRAHAWAGEGLRELIKFLHDEQVEVLHGVPGRMARVLHHKLPDLAALLLEEASTPSPSPPQ